ncbi:galactoside alpha-(1,2)-fucosyltransferase 1 isoform X2 [Eptesicus fuscus]|uniref:galactoside alpha-(1,2)-fucosyltransferase 1 isoform X2 n=2 Tax=Eptesicus fuscus TaxID=29078 RepID=UPI002403E380|nr:galactoside alpha-(1,2)-fucosyltransferase 1 isoform X2 [Eptesicus fuscus]
MWGPAMWTLGRHHLCLTFLLTCVLAGISFLHLYHGLFRGDLGLSFLCADRPLVAAPVAIFCPAGAGMALNTSSSCPQLPAPPSGAWTIAPAGRLGNQMGQYATLLALARLNGRQAFILPAMHAALAPVFRITLPVLAPEADGLTPWQGLELHDWMSEEYARLQQPLLKLSGFPCSWTFFHHLREQIRREFALHDHLRAGAQGFLAQLRLPGTGGLPRTFVGVHVRRGDYVEIMPQRWKGVVADRAYLRAAMDWFRARHEAPVFVVTSNGMAWCRENVDASRGDVVFAGDGVEGSPAKDFALLTQCNHTVMTIGTFGFWAAYLAGGDTVYLANFTLPDSPFLKIFRPEAAFLPEWVGINADLSPLQ